METLDQNLSNESNAHLELYDDSINFLNQTRKWANFLAILGFIFIGLFVILGISFGSIMSMIGGGMRSGMPIPGAAFGFIYVVLALIYFFPVLYLYKFAASMKKAIQLNDQEALSNSFRNLKSHYKFIGILTIVILALYPIIIIVAIGAGTMMH